MIFPVHTVQSVRVSFVFDQFRIDNGSEVSYKVERELFDFVQKQYPHFKVYMDGHALFGYTIQYHTNSDSLMNDQLNEAANKLREEGIKRGLQFTEY